MAVQSLLRLKRQKEGLARFAVTHIPAVAGHVPPYKAWAFLLNNERAVQTGRQMFYIDASGPVFGCTVQLSRAACPPVSCGRAVRLLQIRHLPKAA